MPACRDAHAPYTASENSWLCAMSMRWRRNDGRQRSRARRRQRSVETVVFDVARQSPRVDRASHPSPFAGTKTTLSAPASRRCVARSDHNPLGAAGAVRFDQLRDSQQSSPPATASRVVTFCSPSGERDERVEHFGVGERQEERSDDEADERGGQRGVSAGAEPCSALRRPATARRQTRSRSRRRRTRARAVRARRRSARSCCAPRSSGHRCRTAAARPAATACPRPPGKLPGPTPSSGLAIM